MYVIHEKGSLLQGQTRFIHLAKRNFKVLSLIMVHLTQPTYATRASPETIKRLHIAPNQPTQ